MHAVEKLPSMTHQWNIGRNMPPHNIMCSRIMAKGHGPLSEEAHWKCLISGQKCQYFTAVDSSFDFSNNDITKSVKDLGKHYDLPTLSLWQLILPNQCARVSDHMFQLSVTQQAFDAQGLPIRTIKPGSTFFGELDAATGIELVKDLDVSQRWRKLLMVIDSPASEYNLR